MGISVILVSHLLNIAERRLFRFTLKKEKPSDFFGGFSLFKYPKRYKYDKI